MRAGRSTRNCYLHSLLNEQMGSEGDRKAREMRKGRVGGRSRVLKALFRCLLEFSLKRKASSSIAPSPLSCPRSYPGPEFSGYDSHLRKEGREGWREGRREKGKERKKNKSEKPTSVQGRPSETLYAPRQPKGGTGPQAGPCRCAALERGHVPASVCVCSNLDKQRPIREMEFPWQALDLMGMCRRDICPCIKCLAPSSSLHREAETPHSLSKGTARSP